jgi:hypothetical protein
VRSPNAAASASTCIMNVSSFPCRRYSAMPRGSAPTDGLRKKSSSTMKSELMPWCLPGVADPAHDRLGIPGPHRPAHDVLHAAVGARERAAARRVERRHVADAKRRRYGSLIAGKLRVGDERDHHLARARCCARMPSVTLYVGRRSPAR